jgi:hypothetical protein
VEQDKPSAETPAELEPDAHARRADALLRMAEVALAHEGRTTSTAEQYQVVVHVDADTLAQDGDGLRSHIEDGPRVSAETSRRIACDCSRVCVHEDGEGEILDIGRKSRQVPPAIRRALSLRDGGCRFPGCTQHRHVDAHHLVHWADGGPTSLDNLVLLCRHHHRLVHEGGFSVQGQGKQVRFGKPNGQVLEVAPSCRLPDKTGSSGIERTHANVGLSIDAQTAITRWRGERMDLSFAVAGLCAYES